MPLKQLSPLLPPDQGVYVDTSSSLRPAHAYMYAVMSESTSHVESASSDTVSAIPLISEPVASPGGVEAAVDGRRILVSWNTTLDRDESILGYRVYRKRGAEKKLTPVADTLQEAWQNFYEEKETVPGGTYTYAIRAVSITGDTSAFSPHAVVRVDAPEYFPPGNVRAWKEGKRVQLTWDEVIQPDVAGLRIYRYARGNKPELIKKLKPEERAFTDTKPGRTTIVSYYLTTVGAGGMESSRSRVVTVPLR
ncbi:MAG: hypothetical protein JXA28_09095 [Bacteroidetes bacterium]|nr:hypothetical protein [Bacteroidota bacterium]